MSNITILNLKESPVGKRLINILTQNGLNFDLIEFTSDELLIERYETKEKERYYEMMGKAKVVNFPAIVFSSGGREKVYSHWCLSGHPKTVKGRANKILESISYN